MLNLPLIIVYRNNHIKYNMMKKICQFDFGKAVGYDSPSASCIEMDACDVLCASPDAGTETFEDNGDEYLLF